MENHVIDKRYYFFISAETEVQPEQRVLEHTLLSMGAFSWSMVERSQQTTTFTRRQIEDCDYFVVLLGERYGKESTSGVSFQQLEYVYALTKKKVVFVFARQPQHIDDAHNVDDRVTATKMQHFRKELETQAQGFVYFSHIDDLEAIVRQSLADWMIKYRTEGWIRPSQTIALMKENERLKQQLTQMGATLKEFEAQTAHTLPVATSSDQFRFEYTVHVYQDGNLMELAPTHVMDWLDVLAIVGPAFAARATEDRFAECVNAYLNDIALADVRPMMPQAHAAARAKINMKALQALKLYLRNQSWVVPVGIDDRERVLWELTEVGAQKIQQYQNGNC